MNLGAGISLLLPFGVSAQRCAAPLPVCETGGSKGKGGGQGGGSPGLHKPRISIRGAEGRGYPGRRAGRARDPFRARGVAPLRWGAFATGQAVAQLRLKPSSSDWAKAMASSIDLPCCVQTATILQIVPCVVICVPMPAGAGYPARKAVTSSRGG